jgi:hypothetical protein
VQRDRQRGGQDDDDDEREDEHALTVAGGPDGLTAIVQRRVSGPRPRARP